MEKMILEFDDSIGMTDFEIQEIQSYTQFELTQEVINLFSRHSGGKYKEDKSYFINWKTDFDFELDIWITEVETKYSIINNWKYRDYLDDCISDCGFNNDYVESKNLFPIFQVVNGVIYISIGGNHNRKIFFTDTGDIGIVKISDNLEEFIGKLKLLD